MVDLSIAVSICKLLHLGRFVFHLEVHFATLIVSAQRLDKLADRSVRPADDVQYVNEGNDTGIGVEVIAIIEMPGQLSAEHSVGVAQRLFHERVPHSFLPGRTSVPGDFLGNDPTASQIVDDGRSRRLFQEIGRH